MDLRRMLLLAAVLGLTWVSLVATSYAPPPTEGPFVSVAVPSYGGDSYELRTFAEERHLPSNVALRAPWHESAWFGSYDDEWEQLDASLGLYRTRTTLTPERQDFTPRDGAGPVSVFVDDYADTTPPDRPTSFYAYRDRAPDGCTRSYAVQRDRVFVSARALDDHTTPSAMGWVVYAAATESGVADASPAWVLGEPYANYARVPLHARYIAVRAVDLAGNVSELSSVRELY